MALAERLRGRKGREKYAILRELDRIAAGGKDLDTRDLPPAWIPHLEALQRRMNESEAACARTEASNRVAVAGVAHDLKLPLSVIMGSVECLQEGMDDKDYLALIYERAQQMNSYVLTLNEAAKQETAQAPDEKEEIDTREFFPAAAERFCVIAEDLGIRYKIKRFPKARIYGERSALQRVQENLISNAFKHTGRGGRVTVSAQVKGKEFRLTVQDTGSGIPKKNLPFVFDKFFMGDTSRAGGSGLGLYVTKQIVKQHGGSVGVKSRVGRGSRFWFTLPTRRIKAKYLTDRFENLPPLSKFFVMLFFGWGWCSLFRFIRYAETQCTSTLWGAFIAIAFMPFIWIIDMISVIFYRQITFLSE